MSINKLGIETHLYLDSIDSAYRGKSYQDVRKNRNIAQRVGLVVREGKLDQHNLKTITNISEKWLKNKKNRSELSILIREISLAKEPDVRYFFAELDGEILGYIFFNPIYKDSKIIGYYTNTERYDLPDNLLPGRFNIMTYITYEAIEKFKEENIQFISLGLSPLYDVSNSHYQDNPELTDLFNQMFAENELYAFKGIAFHKMKHPSRKECPVYFAVTRDTLSEDIMNIFKGIGLLGDAP